MNVLILSVCLFFIQTAVFSQAGSQPVRIQVDDNSVVKDSAGTVYPAAVWKALLSNGYTLKAVDPKNKNTEFILTKLTEKQVAERLEKLPRPRESSYFKTGEKLTSFKTTDMEGNKVDLKSLKGKIIVLNFWFINCGPCRKEIPDLNVLVDSFKTNDQVVFLAVALDDKPSLKKFLEQLPFHYRIIDNGRFITSQYKINAYPTHVVVDTEMKVYFHTTGLALNTVHWIKKSITELLAKQSETASAN